MSFKIGAKVVVKGTISQYFVTEDAKPTNNKFTVRLLCMQDVIDVNYIKGLYYEVLGTYIVGTRTICLLKTSSHTYNILLEEEDLVPFEMTDDVRQFFRQTASLIEKYGLSLEEEHIKTSWFPEIIKYDTNDSGTFSIEVKDIQNA